MLTEAKFKECQAIVSGKHITKESIETKNSLKDDSNGAKFIMHPPSSWYEINTRLSTASYLEH